MIADYEAGGNDRLKSPRPYALGLTHKHLPEMAAHTGLKSAPVFTPIVGDFYKGLAVTTFFSPSQLAKKAYAARRAGAVRRVLRGMKPSCA